MKFPDRRQRGKPAIIILRSRLTEGRLNSDNPIATCYAAHRMLNRPLMNEAEPSRATGRLPGVFRRLRERLFGRSSTDEMYRSIFENAIEGIFQTTRAGQDPKRNPPLAKMEEIMDAKEIS